MKKKLAAMTIATAGLAGFVVVGASSAHAFGGKSSGVRSAVTSASSSTGFSKNARGQTYGSAAKAADASQLPDLIEVQLPSGQIGYILRSDFESPDLTLQQVRALPTDSSGAFYTPPTAVPVFASDGVTQIGTMTLGGGQAIGRASASPPPAG